MQFWYLLEGTGTAELKVRERYFRPSSSNVYEGPIWNTKSQANSQWRYTQARISNTYFNYRIYFNALRNDFNGYIGIDDVEIKIGACKPAINCNFEDYTTCSWLQNQEDDMDWILTQGKTDSASTGPHVDHTLGNPLGVYAYIESSYPSKKGNCYVFVYMLMFLTILILKIIKY